MTVDINLRADLASEKPSILIVCGYFPPLNNTAARRPYYMARHFADQGHKVGVVTLQGTEVDWHVSLEGIEVMRVTSTMYPREQSGFETMVTRLYWKLRGTRFERLALFMADMMLPLNIAKRMDLRVADVERQLGRYDTVIATSGPWSMLEFGHRFKLHWNCQYIADYRDPWGIVDSRVGLRSLTYWGKGIPGWWRRSRMLRLEKKYTALADAVVSVSSECLHNTLNIIGQRPSLAVRNGHDPEGARSTPAGNERFTILYTGKVYREQEWDLVDTALNMLRTEHPEAYRGIHLQLVGVTTSHPSDMEHMETLIQNHTCVQVVERVDRERSTQLQQEADLLLHVGFKDKHGILPLKLLEYINSGVPVLQVGTTDDIQRRVVQETGTGKVFQDSHSLSSYLLECHKLHMNGTRIPYHPDLKELSQYTWKHQMENYRQFIVQLHATGKD
ncbi:MAG: glycosyltransferase [Flavobacteriales bacterium]